MLFRPTRASPPSPLRPVLPANLTLALSTQSSVSSLPLDGSTLTPEQIEILDTIIARAPPTATTFLAVFKAYNEVLQERGMDAGEDVVFYRFLLKLGVVRGQDWGERWNTVKSGLGSPVCSSDEEDTPSRKLPPNPKIAAREQLPQRSWTRHLLDDDSNVLHAQGDDTISLDNQPHSTPRGNSLPPLPSHKALEPSHAHPRLMRNQNLSNDRPQTSFSLRTVSRSPSPERRDHLRDHKHWDTNDPHDHDKEALSSLRPPSYRTLPQENSRPGNRNITFLQHLQAQLQDLPSSKPRKSQKTEHQKVSEPVREKAPPTKQEGHVNADEAWRLLEMERDAVEFWEMRLLRQHWDAWRSGFDWVRGTSLQVDQAYSHLLLRSHFHRWHTITTALKVDRGRLLGRMWKLWRRKKEHRWREGMRVRLSVIRQLVDSRILREAWDQWSDAYRASLASKYYTRMLVQRTFVHWHSQYQLSAITSRRNMHDLARCMEVWKMRTKEAWWTREAGGKRVRKWAWERWRKLAHDQKLSASFRTTHLARRVFDKWHAKLSSVQSLDNSLTTYHNRRLRLAFHTWLTKTRCVEIDLVREKRLKRRALAVWKERAYELKKMDALATSFAGAIAHADAAAAFAHWTRLLQTHVNAYNFASAFHSRILLFHSLREWRSRLDEQALMIKKARVAGRWFLKRRLWKRWKGVIEERRRGIKLRQWEIMWTGRVFDRWRALTLRSKEEKLLVEMMRARTSQREANDVLAIWTARVVEIKVRELTVTDEYARRLKRIAFNKWLHVCLRHSENLSLMQSFQDVKREELLRRAFARWIQSARSSSHRRRRLEQREADIRHSMLSEAWDKWRDKFEERRLVTIETDILLQMQAGLLFRGFKAWQSQTKSVPAIRFHTRLTRQKVWSKWQIALPKARREREARQMEKMTLLGKMFRKWQDAYRAKIATKAVARARFLRLPGSASSSTPSLLSRPRPSPFPITRRHRAPSPDQSKDYRSSGSRSQSRRPSIAEKPTPAPFADTTPEVEMSPTRRKRALSLLGSGGRGSESRDKLKEELSAVRKRGSGSRDGSAR